MQTHFVKAVGLPLNPLMGTTIYFDGYDWVNLAAGTAGQTLKLGYPASTVICSSFDGADAAVAYTDPVAGAYTFVGTAQLDTTIKRYGTASLQLDGDSDAVNLPDSNNYNFGTGAFTIEISVYHTSLATAGGEQGYYEQRVNNNNMVRFAYFEAAGATYFDIVVGGVVLLSFYYTWVPTLNTWYDLMLVRIDNADSANSWRLFINGVSKPLTKSSGNWNITMPDLAAVVDIGVTTGIGFFSGYIDNLRVSKGSAIRTANFTPMPYAFQPVPVWTT